VLYFPKRQETPDGNLSFGTSFRPALTPTQYTRNEYGQNTHTHTHTVASIT